MLFKRWISLSLFLACSGLAPTGAAYAQTTFHWLNTGGGSYHAAGNWTPAGGPPLFDDFARFGLSATYGVNFSNAGTQTIDFQVSNGNVTFANLNTTAQHFWGSSSTNYVGPSAADANSSATLNLTNMFHLPMRGNHLIVGRAAGKTGTLNINNNGNWESWSNGNFILGQAGTGNLNISTSGILQKSSLKSSNVSIGATGGTGQASVSGFNASLTATNVMGVGEGAGSLGQLTISNQGKVTVADSLYVGVSSVLDNKITVTGSGSELVLGNDVTSIGFNGGNGTIHLQSGGKSTNNGSSINIGDSAGSTGTLTITGSGSQFLSADSSIMRIGKAGTGNVNVSSGGNLTVSQLIIGDAALGVGSLALQGNGTLVDLFGTQSNVVGSNGTGSISLDTGSVLNSNGGLKFGSSGIGSLSVKGGSQVYSASGDVGSGPSGSSALVSGSGSLWSMTGGLDVGFENAATLQIENGGQVSTNGGRLGVIAGSTGTANITDATSIWNNSGTGVFVVGQSGHGILNLTNGGDMTSKSAVLASQADGQGTVTVNGVGSTWTISNGIFLGDEGQGAMTISNGAEVIATANAFIRVGVGADAVGSLTLTGGGSKISGAAGSSLNIGFGGQGALDIRQGATANVVNGSIGSTATGIGSAVVRNAGSQWNVAETLDVGRAGEGSLLIQNSAKTTAKNLQIGRDFGSKGTVTLSGASSSLEVVQNASVGGTSVAEGGAATLNINSGATATIGNQLTLWSQGEVNLNGGTLKLGSLNDQSGQFNWNSGTVQFTQNTILNNGLLNALVGTAHSLENGQTLEAAAGNALIVGNTNFAVDGGKVQTTDFTNVGATAINKGSLNASGQFLNDVQGTFVLQNLGQASFAGSVINNGSFIMASSAAKSSGGLFTNNGSLSGYGRLQHQLQNNGTLAVNAGSHLINDNGALTSTNANIIQMGGGRLEVTGALSNSSGAFITGHGVMATSAANPGDLGLLNRGVMAFSGGDMDVYGDVRNLSGGRIMTSGNSTTTFWDDVDHNGTEIRTALGSSTVFFGSVSGAGPFTGLGSVFFEGDLKPGNSPADVLFEGDLYLSHTATLNMEIGGLLEGAEFDQLSVLGDVSLDGLLSLTLINGFDPVFGDSFMLIENRGMNALIGQFVGLDQGATLWAGSQQFSVDYYGGSGNDFVITAVPEPSSALLVAAVFGWMSLFRRRETTARNSKMKH